MIQAWIIMKKGLVKKNISERKDSFVFAEKTYFIVQDKIILKSALLINKKILIYFEGVPMPVSVADIEYRTKNKQTVVIIDGASLHDLASIKILNVLTKGTFTVFEKIIIVMIFVNIIVSGVAVYGAIA